MTFTPEVYEQIREGAQRSAARIVPVVHKAVKPKTVIDVGCGEGWFAREFAKLGCRVVAADETVEDQAVIDGVTFIKRTLPQDFADTFDLAVCLEVAEHLPETDAATLVRSLCEAAPIVLFSATIPSQGGHGHINEQWPAYWATKFAVYDRACTDWPRWEFWNDSQVEPWYRQNMLLFGPTHLLYDALVKEEWSLQYPAVVHADIYMWRVAERDRLNAMLHPPNLHTG